MFSRQRAKKQGLGCDDLFSTRGRQHSTRIIIMDDREDRYSVYREKSVGGAAERVVAVLAVGDQVVNGAISVIKSAAVGFGER